MNKVFWDLVKYCVRKDPQTFYNTFLIRSTYSVVNFPKLQARHLVLKPLRSKTARLARREVKARALLLVAFRCTSSSATPDSAAMRLGSSTQF